LHNEEAAVAKKINIQPCLHNEEAAVVKTIIFLNNSHCIKLLQPTKRNEEAAVTKTIIFLNNSHCIKLLQPTEHSDSVAPPRAQSMIKLVLSFFFSFSLSCDTFFDITRVYWFSQDKREKEKDSFLLLFLMILVYYVFAREQELKPKESVFFPSSLMKKEL
jgi:hypothetical protein